MWDAEQLTLFLGEAKRTSRDYPVFRFALGTGLCQAEVLGLQWPDRDWAQKTVYIRRRFYRLGGQQLWDPPKTEARRRAVKLGPKMLEVLRGVQATQAEQTRLLGPEYQDHGVVFAQPNGKPLHGHNLTQRDLRRICKRAGVPRLTFHQLRHMRATYLALAGVPIRVAQERLGHSSARITQEIYQHTLATHQYQAAPDVEAVLFRQRSGGD
jgi:integrase